MEQNPYEIIRELRSEHDLIIESLNELVHTADVIELMRRSDEKAFQSMEETTHFLNRVLKSHFVKTERGVFLLLGTPCSGVGLVYNIGLKHHTLMNRIGKFQEMIGRLENSEFVDGIRAEASFIREILKQHLHEEDQSLFPLVEKLQDSKNAQTAQ